MRRPKTIRVTLEGTKSGARPSQPPTKRPLFGEPGYVDPSPPHIGLHLPFTLPGGLS